MCFIANNYVPQDLRTVVRERCSRDSLVRGQLRRICKTFFRRQCCPRRQKRQLTPFAAELGPAVWGGIAYRLATV